MHDAAAVRIRDGVAGVDQAAQQPAEGDLAPGRVAQTVLLAVEPLDGVAQGLALDESHRIVRPPVGVSPQSIDRHDARMLQPPGEPGLEQEPRLAERVVRVIRPQLLQRDLAIELGVDRQEDLAQPPACVRPHDAKALVDGDGPASITSGKGLRSEVGDGLGDGLCGDRVGSDGRFGASVQGTIPMLLDEVFQQTTPALDRGRPGSPGSRPSNGLGTASRPRKRSRSRSWSTSPRSSAIRASRRSREESASARWAMAQAPHPDRS